MRNKTLCRSRTRDRRQIFLGLICCSLLLSSLGCSHGAGRAEATPLKEAGTQSSSPEPWITPLPWTEMYRVTSPDGKVDAVIVTRPDSGPPDYLLHDPTDLYLVPQGEQVKREPSFPPYPSATVDPIAEFRKQVPFHSYDAKGVSLKWKDNSTVLVGAKVASVYKKEESHELAVGGKGRLVKIRYFIEWDSWARKEGPPVPEK